MRRLFIDRVLPGNLAQTSVLVTSIGSRPTAMAFSGRRLWISTVLEGKGETYSARATHIGDGLTLAGNSGFPTAIGELGFTHAAMFPNTLPCIPSRSAGCLHNRFRVEVQFGTPGNSKVANIVV